MIPTCDVNLDEVRKAIQTFEKASMRQRVFLPDDSSFNKKFNDFADSVARFGVGTRNGDAIVTADRTIFANGGEPVNVEIFLENVLVILDNTEIGWFTNPSKSACREGALITSKGILALNIAGDAPKYSGFISWHSLANGKTPIGGFSGGAYIFNPKGIKPGAFPTGPRVAVLVARFKDKNLQDNIEILLTHIKRIAQGRGAEFDKYDVIGEDAEESDDGESAEE